MFLGSCRFPGPWRGFIVDPASLPYCATKPKFGLGLTMRVSPPAAFFSGSCGDPRCSPLPAPRAIRGHAHLRALCRGTNLRSRGAGPSREVGLLFGELLSEPQSPEVEFKCGHTAETPSRIHVAGRWAGGGSGRESYAPGKQQVLKL